MKNIAIILGAGDGLRFNRKIPKIFVKIAGREIICHTIEKFEKHKKIDEIVLVVRKDLIKKCKDLISKENFKKVSKIVSGGKTRQESSYSGLKASFNENCQNILFHDAVRPFVSHRVISDVLKKLGSFSAVSVAIPSSDTLVEVDKKGIIKRIPDRKNVLREQTPQGFRLSVIKKAHEMALREGLKRSTDDCSLVLKYNLSDVFVVRGEEKNIKITYPNDIYLAEKILKEASGN
jgi:ribitol-5-phosphate 2-dehydrogenase (NADP+) / D-ribitol-5-phosphate cytidylyltransferase